MEIAEKPITIYKNVMLGLLAISVCATFFASYIFIGLFIGSPVHLWLKNQMILAPIIKELIDVEPMIVDALVKAIYPMFVVWSVIFFVYPYFKNNTDSFNSYIKVTSLFFGGPSWILFLLGSGCLGIGVYAINADSTNAGLGISAISLILFIFPAWYFRRYKTVLVSEDNKLMGKYSSFGGWVFTIFALIGYLWSIFAEPVRTLISIYEAWPCS
ncbi:hypothetical protein GV054_08290 [Marinomonas mediterranea]|jgi:hypothetical protein|uniref:Uncharacterized protein n=1 Tax=Marinomonas mediterranea (strain ATCC 700492 / JCM 21426 / NBRC 103028 / MMB-1) TaxID=717774 RepID=F2JZS8_MARM1|nr:hypothetical protein [Marinomonas mediterranea]ADZ90932.1 hypothetical protein Marme_1673 [Marinomonas mediterranea MMB-1]WCN13002.1 hypothetical protein GV054_08290 [Marinomonas mediterranea]WCN17075.1 hypothetical protein GV053_08470 [Marinomonas mediterranea MMB-1]